MNWHHRASLVVVTGMKGTGKTTLALKLRAASRARWQFFFDPEREFSLKLRVPASTRPDDMAHRAAHKLPVCFDPADLFPNDRKAAFAFFCRWTLDFCRITHPQRRDKFLVNGPKLLLADEIQSYTTTGNGGITPEFAEVLNQGRRHELDLILMSQAPNFIHQNIRVQTTEIYTLRHEEESVLKWLRADFDVDQVKRLRVPGGYLHKRKFAINHAPDEKRNGSPFPRGRRQEAREHRR